VIASSPLGLSLKVAHGPLLTGAGVDSTGALTTVSVTFGEQEYKTTLKKINITNRYKIITIFLLFKKEPKNSTN